MYFGPSGQGCAGVGLPFLVLVWVTWRTSRERREEWPSISRRPLSISCERGVGPFFRILCVHCTAVNYFHVGAD